MTDNHPITPPPELVELLRYSSGTWRDQITIAYRAGADQELEACCEWLKKNTDYHITIEFLRDARRPKPPSLREQALAVLDDCSDRLDSAHENTIRRALEALPE